MRSHHIYFSFLRYHNPASVVQCLKELIQIFFSSFIAAQLGSTSMTVIILLQPKSQTPGFAFLKNHR